MIKTAKSKFENTWWVVLIPSLHIFDPWATDVLLEVCTLFTNSWTIVRITGSFERNIENMAFSLKLIQSSLHSLSHCSHHIKCDFCFFASCTMPLYFGIMWLESNQEHFSIYCLLKMWIRVHIFTLDPCSYGVSFSPATPSWCHIWLKGNFLWHRWCWSRSCPCSGSCPKDPQIILSCLFSLIHLIYIHKPPVTPLSAPSSTDHYFFFVSLSKCQ